MTIKTKLLVVLLSLTVALAATAAAGWFGLAVNREAFRTVYDDRVLPLRQLKDVSDMYAVNIVGAAQKLRAGALSWDDGVKTVDAGTAVIARQWNAYLGTYLTPEESKLAGEAGGLMATANASVGKLRALMTARDAAGLLAYVTSDMYPAIDPVTRKLGELVDLQRRVAGAEFSRAGRVSADIGWLQIVLMPLGLGAVVLGAWLTIGGVSRPLTAMTAAMKRISKGDFTAPVPAIGRTDEIGAMAAAVEVFRQAGLTNARLQGELREAERRAVQAEQQMRSIVDSLPLGLVLYDENERRILVNQWIAAELPGAREHLSPLRHEEILRRVPPDDVTTADGRNAQGQAAVDLMMSTYRSQPRGVMAMRRGDRSFAVHFANLPGVGRIVAATNVTDLVHAQRAAQESEQRLRTAIAEIPMSFAMFAADGTLRLFNEEFRREFRNIPDVIRTGVAVRDFVAAYLDVARHQPRYGSLDEWRSARHDPVRREAFIDRVMKTLLDDASDTVDVERVHGTYRIRWIKLPNGEIVRVSADITDLRQKEAEIRRLGESALAQRTTVLQEIIDRIPQAVLVLGGDRKVRFVNRSVSELIGGGERTEHPPPLEEILAAIGAPPSLIADLPKEGLHEIEVTSRDQKPLRIRAISVPTGDVLITVSDLSDQRRAEAERLEQQQRVLEAEKSQAVLTLAGTIAHDFNNLLAVILGFSSLASAAAKKVLETSSLPPADAQELADVTSSLDKVVTSAERGRNVVASLNALSQERQARVERLDLRAVVKDVEQLLRVLVPASIRLDLALPRSPCAVVANATQIEQIVTNLCVNAVHALEGKAGQVSISVDTVDVDGGRAEGLRVTDAAAHKGGSHIEVAEDGSVSMFIGVLTRTRHARLRVVDNGRGMTEDVARKIFTPFFTTKAPGVGTGLGLSSVVEIVASHQGGIHVRTKPRIGSAFMILFPLADEAVAKAETSVVAPSRAEAQPDADIRTETRILVVDDENLLAELASNVLRKAGYEVEAFTDPMAALGRLRTDPFAFDVIVTDQTMPAMTGMEMIEQIRPLRPEVPIIICTGRVPELEKNGALPPGIKHVLRKPYSPVDLTRLVRQALTQDLPVSG